MTRAAWTSALLIAALSGCGLEGVGPGSPDAGTADGGPDLADAMNNPPTTGLFFTFRSYPDDLPAPPSGMDELAIERATFDLMNVRAVGDAAPGDSRTTAASLVLDYRKEGLSLSFPDAPPGVYSFLIAEVRSYEIIGTVKVKGETRDFEIHDEPGQPLTVNVDLQSHTLESGVETIRIKTEIKRVADAVDWKPFENSEDDIEIENDYSKIDDLRARVVTGFKLDP